MSNLTVDDLVKILMSGAPAASRPRIEAAAQRHHESVVEAMLESDITTPLRMAYFLGECSHESNRLTQTEENERRLDYEDSGR